MNFTLFDCLARCANRNKNLIIAAVCILLGHANFARANVVGSDFQNFNPTTNGVDFVSVQSGQTLKPGIFNLGLFLNYAVNAIPEFRDGKPYNPPGGKTRNFGVFSDFNLGLGLTSFWDIGLSFPAILSQHSDDKTERIQYNATGVNEFRANTKVKLVGSERDALALVATANMNRIENNPYSGVPSKPIYTLELAGHTSIEALRLGLNAGYRKKNPGKAITDPVDPNETAIGTIAQPFHDQFIASAAASYLFKATDSKLIFELYGSEPVHKDKSPSEILQRSGEALLGIKHDVTAMLAIHAGVTAGIVDSPATPDWRIYAGINWNGGPFWSKKTDYKDRPIVAKGIAKNIKAGALPENDVVRETFVLDNILFATGSAKQVLEGALRELNDLADHLKSLPAWSMLVVEGHTDSVGENDANLKLSQDRADAIRAHLIKRLGLDPKRIKAVGFGETQPVADNENFQGRQQNRRVEIKIYD